MNLVAIYDEPPDPSKFDHEYFNSHLPLIRAVPGLKGVQVSKLTRTVMGREMYMIAIMEFEDEASLKAAMNSPEMRAAGENLNSFAGGLTHLFFAEPV